MATSNNDRISSQRLLDTLKGLQASRHLGSEPEVDPQTNEKTKHTIKQDYLPNADWNVNDPDADGYVHGRTHWVEIDETEATINVLSSTQVGNFAEGTSNKFGAIKRFTYPTGEYNPGRTGEIISITNDGQTIQFAYIGEDANGDAIAPTNLSELESALNTTNIGIMLLRQDDNNMVYIAYPNANTGDTCNAYLINEIVHQIPNKYIDFPEVEIPENWKMDYDKPNGAQYSMNTGIGNGGGFPFLAEVYCKLGERQTPSDTSKRLLYFFNTVSSGNWVNDTVSKYLNDMQIRLNELLTNGNKTDVRVVVAYLANKSLLSVYIDEYDNLNTAEEYFPDEIKVYPDSSFDVHYTSAGDPSHTASLYTEGNSSIGGTGIFISSGDIDFTKMTIGFGGHLNPMFFNQAPVESNVEYGIKIPDIQYDISFYNVKVAENIIMRYDLFIGSRGFSLDRSSTDDKIFSGTIYLPAQILKKLFNTTGTRGMKGVCKNVDPNFTDTLEYHFTSGKLTVERVYDVAPSASQIRGSCNLEYFTWVAPYMN